MQAASVPFSIPPGSPLAVSWRATLAELIARHGLAELLDAVAACAELAHRQNQTDPLDCAAPARRRIYRKLYPAEFRRSRGFLGTHGRAKRIQIIA